MDWLPGPRWVVDALSGVNSAIAISLFSCRCALAMALPLLQSFLVRLVESEGLRGTAFPGRVSGVTSPAAARRARAPGGRRLRASPPRRNLWADSGATGVVVRGSDGTCGTWIQRSGDPLLLSRDGRGALRCRPITRAPAATRPGGSISNALSGSVSAIYVWFCPSAGPRNRPLR